MARPLKRCEDCPLRTLRSGATCAGCSTFDVPSETVVVVAAQPHDSDALVAQVRLDGIPNLTAKQRRALAEGIAERVGYQKVMCEGQRVWRAQGRGNKPNRDLAAAVYDCGELWTRVTGRDWRRRAGWTGEETSDEILDTHPPIILARELLRLATGKTHPFSLDRAFRRARV